MPKTLARLLAPLLVRVLDFLDFEDEECDCEGGSCTCTRDQEELY